MGASVIPDVPEGAPSWVYVVAVTAAVLVVGIGAAPSIIEKWRSKPPAPPAPPSTPPAAAEPTRPLAALVESDRSPPTDTLRAMIVDLQLRLDRSESREDALQERLLGLTGQLATAQAEISSLRSQVQIMSMRRD